jgi:hypothetical protein
MWELNSRGLSTTDLAGPNARLGIKPDGKLPSNYHYNKNNNEIFILFVMVKDLCE